MCISNDKCSDFFFFFKKGLENNTPHLIINVSDDNVNNPIIITIVFLYLMMKTLYNGIYLLNIYVFENLKSVRASFINIFLLFTPFSFYVWLIDYVYECPFPPKLLLLASGISCFFPRIRHTVQSRYSNNCGVLTSYLLQYSRLFFHSSTVSVYREFVPNVKTFLVF